MTGLSVLLLGIALGLRHATDPDHVVVVSALVQRQPGVWKAARIAALWGAGHTAAFLGVGLLVLLAEVRIPEAFERLAELLVASMLIAFGCWHIATSRTSFDQLPGATQPASNGARPVLIGLVHGLAGSAGIALLAATTIASRPLAVAYLGLFGLGTVLGMVALTMLLARPISRTMRRDGFVKQGVTILAALLSMMLGAIVLVQALGGEGAP